MPEIDFAAIKAAVTVEAAARFLGLELKAHGDTFRCACPTCQQGGDRCIVITPAKRAWYCFGMKKGGDAIYLVAHVKGIKQSEAAKLLQNHFMRPEEKPKATKKRRSTKPPKPSCGTEPTSDYTIIDHMQHWS